jgi:hypothetical protein
LPLVPKNLATSLLMAVVVMQKDSTKNNDHLGPFLTQNPK